jgi:hypothetical protein
VTGATWQQEKKDIKLPHLSSVQEDQKVPRNRTVLMLGAAIGVSFGGCGNSSDAPVVDDGSGGTSISTGSGGQGGGGGSATSGSAGSLSAGGGGSAGMAVQGGAAGVSTVGDAGGSQMQSMPTCTDTVLRTAPPAGKEFLKAGPIDNKFPFSTHWMGRFSANPAAVGITGMADFDHDGDLDFASGQRGGDMDWWEYCTPDHWVQHRVGSGHNSPGGGNAMDADGDGWVDLIAGDSWYRNPKNPRQSEWQRFPDGVLGGAEDIAVGDINGDGKADALWVWNTYRPQWRTPGTDPTMPWPLGAQLENIQTQGGSIGDIDGDGDSDIVVGNRWWYRNLDGKGTQWETVFIADGFDDSPLTNIGDVDGDGDMDIVMCTHFGARAAWVENKDGKGVTWALHILASNKNKLHSIYALDFDNDGDLDIYSGEDEGNAWIWENTDGKGTFLEHSVAMNWRGHDARVGDVDCDGDLDIAGKPWGEGDAEPRDQIYMQNMLVETGGKAVFVRPKSEVWHKIEDRKCP